MDKKELMEDLASRIIEGDENGSEQAALHAVEGGVDPLEAIKLGAGEGMRIVGEKFQNFEIFLPQVMLAADAMKACLKVLLPKISEERRKAAILGKVVIGTISGDIHDIGKNLVAAMLSVAGFEVYDVGVDISPKRFVEKALEVNADIIAISDLLTTSLCFQEDLIRYLADRGLRSNYFVIVGGGPVTPEWAERIGADGYGRYADDGAEICRKLMLDGARPPLKNPIVLSGMEGLQ
ncbi:MAG TPA: corrinoid protein [Candidatus Bathyarchaeia archaeon]|nr:corrinoid protein [Candidatus Bathyarchaeia archaeon]